MGNMVTTDEGGTGMMHGTYSGYKHGCRCTDCKNKGQEVNRNRGQRTQKRFSVEPILALIPTARKTQYKSLFRSGRTIRRYDADRFCVKELGLHPFFVYGDEWYE